MQILQQKFPLNISLGTRMRVGAAYGVFVMLFLVWFKPFGMDELPSERVFTASIIYGVITFACIVGCSMGLTLLFPNYFREENWTTGRHIFITTITVLLVGIVNYGLSPLFLSATYSWRNMFWFQGATLSLALLPITIYSLLAQNRLLKKFELQAAQLEQKLQEKLEKEATTPLPEKASGHIELTGDNQNEQLILPLDDFYYITAANNYIKVYFRKNNAIVYTIVRMTMKKAEEALLPWQSLFRCHRAYIVNLDKVQHVEGNAQGYKLLLQDAEEPVPVSRSLNSELSDRLLAVRKYVK